MTGMLTPVSKVVRGMVGPTYLVLHPLKFKKKGSPHDSNLPTASICPGV